MMEQLYEKLISYQKTDYYPMHMPGHKRNAEWSMNNPYGIDITEIDGFDNFHQPEGVLMELSERIRQLYGAVKSYPLINGSTAGILAGISAAAKRGEKVLVARNSHKSVYHGITLRGLKPVYCYPQYIKEMGISGGILAEEIEKVLIACKDIKLVIITSPTYEGVVSDIQEIAETVHRFGAYLMVDEAHGAHFGFHPGFPESAVSKGADIVIQSLHKTLPSFTQTAVLHSNLTELNSKLERYLAIYQSSSPSYLLMAGIDRCIGLLEQDPQILFSEYLTKLQRFYQSMEKCRNIRLLNHNNTKGSDIFDLDPSKLVISVRNTPLTGHQLQKLLREKYHIIMEMEAPDYVLGMTSICDTNEGFERLTRALLEIDGELIRFSEEDDRGIELFRKPCQKLIPQDALEQPSEYRKLIDSEGCISAAFVGLYPPGIPLLVPGEQISKELIAYINRVRHQGITVTGLSGAEKDEIEVIRRD